MREISFNKKEDTVFCIKCKVSKVPVRSWDRPCKSCRTKIKKKGANLKIGKRQPAAVLKTETGAQVFVDKFGNEVKDHGYDLEKDPRGWEKTGQLKKKGTLIK